MTTINADLFQALNNLSDTDITNTNAEYVLQTAIDRLNTYGAGISDLSGVAGTKSIVATSAQAGAILEVARLIYWGYYNGQETISVGNLGVSPTNMLTDPNTETKIKQLASQLQGRSFLRT